jgi:hypothetical protein
MSEIDVRAKTKNTSILIMGFVWIALGLFGIIFDPEKSIIITT